MTFTQMSPSITICSPIRRVRINMFISPWGDVAPYLPPYLTLPNSIVYRLLGQEIHRSLPSSPRDEARDNQENDRRLLYLVAATLEILLLMGLFR